MSLSGVGEPFVRVSAARIRQLLNRVASQLGCPVSELLSNAPIDKAQRLPCRMLTADIKGVRRTRGELTCSIPGSRVPRASFERAAALLQRLQELDATLFDPPRGSPDHAGACKQVGRNGGFWGPWL